MLEIAQDIRVVSISIAMIASFENELKYDGMQRNKYLSLSPLIHDIYFAAC